MEKGSYRSATNRAYYAVFHTINALHALDGMGFKRHKDVIGNFNKNYVKTKVFPSDYGRRVSFLEQARRESDYMDYHIPNEDEARSHFSFAVEFVGVLTKYIEAKLNEVKKC